MIPSYQIQKIDSKRYVIKRKVLLLYPFYMLHTMTKNEFIGDLTYYGDHVMGQKDAAFQTITDAYDALHQHAMIKGISEIVVKVKDNKYLF